MKSNLLSVNNYNVVNWSEKFNGDIHLEKLYIHSSWDEFLAQEKDKDYWNRLDNYLTHSFKITENKVKIFPYPDLIFNALNFTPLDKIKVIILGQDPYHDCLIKDEKIIPQAMGLSFSVPVGMDIPSSLSNIFKNQLKFGNISSFPKHGNLSFWAYQGCLLLNTSLTVQYKHPNSHAKFWETFSDNLIKYISDKLKDRIFVLWGSPALSKLKFIDQDKHKVLISSHPSGLSNTKPLKHYKPFVEVDHFGEINKFLESNGEDAIIWQIA